MSALEDYIDRRLAEEMHEGLLQRWRETKDPSLWAATHCVGCGMELNFMKAAELELHTCPPSTVEVRGIASFGGVA